MENRIYALFAGRSEFPNQEIANKISEKLESFLQSINTESGEIDHSLRERFRNTDIPTKGMKSTSYINFLLDKIIPHVMCVHSPNYIGHMTTPLPDFILPLNDIVTLLHQNVVKTETSKVITYLEKEAIGKLHRLAYRCSESFYSEHVQHPDSTLGNLVSGGTLANLTALWCARNQVLGTMNNFSGVGTQGFYDALRFHGFQKAVVIGSSLMHYSFDKVMDMIGLGSENLIKVPVDEQGHIKMPILRQTIQESRDQGYCVIAVIGIAGTTETGAIDELEKIADIAGEFSIPFHVDAAWGGPVLFSKRHRHKLSGLERANSITMDGHKQLYLPIGTGMVLFKEPHYANVLERHSKYIIRKGSHDLGRHTLEGSKPASAIFLHASLSILGHEGYEFLINDGIQKARYLADFIKSSPSFELLVEPQLNIVNYRYIPTQLRVAKFNLDSLQNEAINKLNKAIQKKQRVIGNGFVSRTTLTNTRYGNAQPIVVFRSVLANPWTTEPDIKMILEEQRNIGEELEKQL